MKKLGLVIVLLSSFGSLTACNSNKPEVKQQVVSDCTFHGTQTPAPNWICDETIPKLGLGAEAMGTWEKSKAGYGFMKKMAAAQARGELATIIGVKVKKTINQTILASGRGKTEVVKKMGDYALSLFTSENLVGSRIYKSRTAPNGAIFVLVGMTKADVKRTVTEILQADQEENPDQWQEFGASQGQEEIIEEVANSF